jgi:hypothetical protein
MNESECGACVLNSRHSHTYTKYSSQKHNEHLHLNHHQPVQTCFPPPASNTDVLCANTSLYVHYTKLQRSYRSHSPALCVLGTQALCGLTFAQALAATSTFCIRTLNALNIVVLCRMFVVLLQSVSAWLAATSPGTPAPPASTARSLPSLLSPPHP